MPQERVAGGYEILAPDIVPDQKLGRIPKQQDPHRCPGLAGPQAISQLVHQPRRFGNPDPIAGGERCQ